MKLWYDRNSKDPTYFVQLCYRNGNKVTTKNIKRIGKHSELLKITDDPLAYAKEEVAKATKEKQDNQKSIAIPIPYSIDFNETVKDDQNAHKSHSLSLNTGYLYLQFIYQKLKLSKFFENVAKTRKYTYDCNEINRFMTFARILKPASKRSTQLSLFNYYEKPDIKYHHILRYLDVLAENYDNYIAHLFKYSNKICVRNTSVSYFDCSNFYFEIEEDDDDYVDPVTHEDIIGLRKYGFSKEHRPNPVVQMGIFMDEDGLPMSMAISHGSESEQLMAVPCESKLVQMLDNKSFIYCADAGLGSESIRLYNSMGGRAFIVTQSIKKLSNALQKIVFTDENYRRVSDNKKVTLEYLKTFDKMDPNLLNDYNDRAYKVIPADKLEDLGLTELKVLKNGSTKKVKAKGVLYQYVIVTFSRKYMEYQKYVREKRIERAKKIIASQNAGSYKKGPNDIRHYIKTVTTDKDGKNVNTTYLLDEEAVKEEEKYDGFYGIAVNLEVLDDKGNPIHSEITRILEILHQRYLIETLFRILKTYFKTRPIFLSTRNHIIGHFMICYTSLLVYRLLQKLMNDLDKDQHFTEDDIIDTLNCMNIVNIDEYFYRADYCNSDTLRTLELLTNLGLNKKNYLPKTLNSIVRSVK